jgi:phosphatidylserine decarboxylase
MLFDFLIQNFSKINKNGINTILILAVVALCVSFFSNFFGSLLFFLTIFSLYFFRDPDRVTPTENSNGIIFAPADGVITSISKVNLPKKFSLDSENLREGEEMMKISIFLNVFDVHVNRSPVHGDVKKVIYSPGKFINVTKEKESEDNESNTLIIKSANKGEMIVVTQIAGLIARRIICDKKQDDQLIAGERFGIIKFGSRVNIYLPMNYQILVTKGQRMIGGETIVGFDGDEGLKKFTTERIKQLY